MPQKKKSLLDLKLHKQFCFLFFRKIDKVIVFSEKLKTKPLKKGWSRYLIRSVCGWKGKNKHPKQEWKVVPYTYLSSVHYRRIGEWSEEDGQEWRHFLRRVGGRHARPVDPSRRARPLFHRQTNTKQQPPTAAAATAAPFGGGFRLGRHGVLPSPRALSEDHRFRFSSSSPSSPLSLFSPRKTRIFFFFNFCPCSSSTTRFR